MDLSFDSLSKTFNLTLKGAQRHTTALGTDVYGNIARIDNLLGGMEEQLIMCQEKLENTKMQLENARIETEKTFPQEDELNAKTARLNELNILLNLDKHDNEIADDEPETDDTPEREYKEMER